MCGLSQWIGGAAFGCVVGFITYRTLRRAKATRIGELSAVIATIGGGGVIGFSEELGGCFVSYAVGLFAGFFGYLILCLRLRDSPEREWLDLPD